MMAAWTNLDWRAPIPRELCGRISDAFTPCEHRRPCPVHDAASQAGAPVRRPPHDPAGAPALPLPPMLEAK